MKRIGQLLVLSAAIAAMAGPAVATPTVRLSVKSGHPKIMTQVGGRGFTANEAIDVYFDTTDEFLTTADSAGAFPNQPLNVPKDALPGSHWITAVGRQTGDSAQQLFTVRTDWKKYAFDAANRGKNPYENVIDKSNVGTLALAWSYALVDHRAPLVGSPIAYGNLIYFETGQLLSLYALTTEGTLDWRDLWSTEGYSSTGPTYEGGTVYLADRAVNGFNWATGVLTWDPRGPGGADSSPVVAGDILYVNSSERIFAISTATGTTQPLWIANIYLSQSNQKCFNPKRSRVSSPTITIGSPAVVNGVVYVGYNYGVCALNAATGAVLWTGTNGGTEPTVANGVVYSASGDGTLYALSADTGDVLWTFASGSMGATTPSVDNGKVFVGLGQTIYALDENSGALDWSAPIDGQVPPSSVSLANGLGYLTSDQTVYALDLRTGARLWTATSGSLTRAPTVVNGFVYVNSSNFKLYAYALNGGDNAVYKPRLPPSYASLHPDHRLKVSH